MFQISSITLKNSELEMAGLGIFAMKFYVNSWSPRSTSHNIQNVRLFGPRRSWFGHITAMAKTAPLQSNNFWNCLAANCGPWWVWVFFGTPKRKNSRTLVSLSLTYHLRYLKNIWFFFLLNQHWAFFTILVFDTRMSKWWTTITSHFEMGLWSDERFLITILFPCFALKHTAITAHVDNQNS